MQYLKIFTTLFCLAVLILATRGEARPIQEGEETSKICASAVRAQEKLDAIPLHLLSAISQAESGRWNSEQQANIAWPWTVSANGTGKFFASKLEAVAAVEFLMTSGVRNIDVGCMQINLAAHANAFETIEHAFEPIANVAYGAKYLKIMHQRSGNWLDAAGGYHSTTPHLFAKYRDKIRRIWNKLLGIQKTIKKITSVKPPSNVGRRYPASTIDYARVNRLNRNYHQHLGLSAKADGNNPASRLANKRRKQIAAWRRSQSRGEDLSVLASIRQAEHAKRRKRKLAALGKENRQVVFTERRRQQLQLWRNQHLTGLD